MGVGIDQELIAIGTAIGVVALGVDAGIITMILAPGVPRDQEAAVSQRADAGVVLLVIGVGIDLKFAAVRAAIGVVALGVDALPIAVLVYGLPGDQEAAVV